ncbi:phage tail protein [Niallia alba]|uniref:DUF7359 domain-containing protein n=1 Tax=Niallia alba TaxID=2729105 RepID=UPI002E22739F|nr:phage tail protein [Niallia alba]
MFLCSPKENILFKLNDAQNVQLDLNTEELSSLSFILPYKIVINHKLVDYKPVSIIKEKFLIRLKMGLIDEWFVITSLKESSSDKEELIVNCFLRPYEIRYKKYKDYTATSYTIEEVSNDCLSPTGWKVGYVTPSIKDKKRQFDLSGGNRLDFLNEIANTFDVVIIYDTHNKLVNYYTESEITTNKGFRIRDGQYITSISNTKDADEIVTRLTVYGAEDLTINGVNPTGQSYIEDFSYFMQGYETDENGKVISSSVHYMSDELCQAILEHKKIIETNQDTVKNYQSQLTNIQQQITTLSNERENLQLELTMVEDLISSGSSNIDELLAQKEILTNQIADKNNTISTLQSEELTVTEKLKELVDMLVLEKYLPDNLASELIYFIQEDDWKNDNISDVNDLYEAGLKELSKRNSPPINTELDLINFLNVMDEKHNWDRLALYDLVYVYHSRLKLHIRTMISSISINFDAETIKITISNSERVASSLDKLATSINRNNKTTNDYNNRITDLRQIANNFNNRNDRISAIPKNPRFDNKPPISHQLNDNGSADITINWQYDNYEITKLDEDNIDGFFIYAYTTNTIESVSLGGSNEKIFQVNPNIRSFTLPSSSQNSYCYVGIQAYRQVDADVPNNINGLITSEIATPIGYYPYLVNKEVVFNGRVNGVKQKYSATEPSDLQVGDIWFNTITNIQYRFTEEGYKPVIAASSSSVNGYAPSVTSVPSTVVIRDDTGKIDGSITGSAQSLNGKSESDFAQIDSQGNLLNVTIPQSMQVGSYSGNGVTLREIIVPFKPKLVEIFTTNTTEDSLFIPSSIGGYKYNTLDNHFTLVGDTLNSPNPSFGKLTESGFIIGTDTELNGNKNGTTYYYKAYRE